MIVLALDDTALRHLAKALDNHRAWCRTNGIAMPRPLADLAVAASSGQQRSTFGDDGEPLHDEVSVAEVPVLLTYQQVADLLTVGERTVRRLVAAGALPAVHIGRASRIHRSDLDAYANQLREND